jgi:hypothetical protein
MRPAASAARLRTEGFELENSFRRSSSQRRSSSAFVIVRRVARGIFGWERFWAKLTGVKTMPISTAINILLGIGQDYMINRTVLSIL